MEKHSILKSSLPMCADAGVRWHLLTYGRPCLTIRFLRGTYGIVIDLRMGHSLKSSATRQKSMVITDKLLRENAITCQMALLLSARESTVLEGALSSQVLQVMTPNENRQHNLRLPISRIPNENLSRIFRSLRNSSFQPKYFNSWIGITHVCHAWREVAFNTPSLWCHIDVLPSFRNWIPELLRRSKQSPLTLLVHSRENGILGELKNHFERVCKLELDSPYKPTLDKIFSSQIEFRNLETLVISQSNPIGFVLNDARLRATCLRSLTLHSFAVDWNSKFLRGLTHLSLRDIPNRLGCYDFTLILSKFPALETLHLARFLLEEEQAENHQPAKIHLQHLRQLHVECEVPQMARFLPCLVIPRSCKLRIYTWNDYDEICDKFRTILSWVSNQLASLSASDATDHEKRIQSCHFRHDPEMVDFKVQGFHDVLSHEQLKTADPIFEFVVLWTYEDDNFSFNLQTFFSLLPLGELAFLDVETDFDVYLSPEFWTVAFGSIQTMNTAYLNTPTSNFWQAMVPVNNDHTVVESLPFPALASITVEDYSLDYQLVLDKLRVRSQLGGTQLQDLRFLLEDEAPSEPIVMQLGELVSRIQFVGLDVKSDMEDSEDDE